MEENSNQQMEKNSNETPKFDFNNVPKENKIMAGIALLGAIGVFLPWVKVSFFGISQSSSGINAWQGWTSLIILLGFIAIVIAGDLFKIDNANKEKIIKFTPILPAILTFIAFVQIISESYVAPGFGIFVTLLSTIALILIGFNVIKLKK